MIFKNFLCSVRRGVGKFARPRSEISWWHDKEYRHSGMRDCAILSAEKVGWKSRVRTYVPYVRFDRSGVKCATIKQMVGHRIKMA